MRLEGYEKRYGLGVAAVYAPGKQQIDMINDINDNIKQEIEAKLPADPSVEGVAGLFIDLGDTQYGLGTLGRRYVDIVDIHRVGYGPNNFTSRRIYCPGPSLVQAVGLRSLTDGVMGELLRIRHGLKTRGEPLTIRYEDLLVGPAAQCPPYPTANPYGGNRSVPFFYTPRYGTVSSRTQGSFINKKTISGSVSRKLLEPKLTVASSSCSDTFLELEGSGPDAPRFKTNGTSYRVTAKFFIQDDAEPIDVALPLQNGRLKLAAHKVALGEAGVERFGRWQIWKCEKKKGGWKDITWEVSVRGKRGDVLLFKKHEVESPKDLDLHVDYL